MPGFRSGVAPRADVNVTVASSARSKQVLLALAAAGEAEVVRDPGDAGGAARLGDVGRDVSCSSARHAGDHLALLEPLHDRLRRGALDLGQRRSEEHTSELQSPCNLVCRLLLEKKKKKNYIIRKYNTQHTAVNR